MTVRSLIVSACFLSLCAICAGCKPVPPDENIAPAPTITYVRESADATFQQDLRSARQPVFVDFYATWCRPCKRMTPLVDQLSIEYREKATFLKIDVDKCPAAATKYLVNVLPSFKVFDDGKEIASWEGMASSAQLRSLLAALPRATPTPPPALDVSPIPDHRRRCNTYDIAMTSQ